MQFKKLLTLALFGLGVTGGARAQTCTVTINTYPYFENMEGPSSTDWKAGGTNTSWAWGTPNKTVLKTAASGTKAWVTNLTSSYNASERSFVEGPCFNMSTLVKPTVEIKLYWKADFSNDGAVLQSSIDNGTTWQNVGAMGDPFNWYNDNTIGGAPGGQSAGTAQGWTGVVGSGGSGGWVTVRHELTGLGGKPSVKLRLAFGSDFSNQDEGVAFDDFAVYETPANDASIAGTTAPGSPVVPGTSQPVAVTVKNFGASPLTAASLRFSVNGVAQPAFAWTGSVAPGATSAPVQIGSFTFGTGAQQIKAWSSAPNGATDAFTLNDTAATVIYSCNPLAGNYTINKNLPASATNFTSFTAAAQMLGNCGVSGPVTISVVPNSGPYNEQVILPAIAGSSATNLVTFEGNNNVLGFNTSLLATPGIFVFNGADYVKLKDLTINADAAATKTCGIQFLNGSDNNFVLNCTINLPLTIFLSEVNGIIVGPQTTQVGNHGSKLTFQNNTINGGYYGIFLNGQTSGTAITNNQILNNQILDSYAYGIYVNAAGSGTVIEGNDFSRPNRVNATNLTAIFLGGSTINTIISKNRIHNTHDKASSTNGTVNGIHTTATATAGNENIIKNNLIYNLNNAGGTVYALYNQNGSSTYYYHNTVSIDNPAINFSTVRGMYFASASTNVKFINNILSLTSTSTSKHAIFIGDQNLTLDCNYNDLYVGATGKIGSINTQDKATLADWQTVKSNAFDQNSVSVDPFFISLSQPKPLSPSLNNIGQALPAVTDDFTGAPRNATTPDPGAYEFTPALNDAGISAIAAPVSPVTPGNQAVQVNVKNYGTAALTSATINWSINGVLQTPFNWTGNLTTMQASAAVTIGNFTFSTGNYILKSWTQNPNGVADPIALNDSSTLKVISCNAMAGNFTIDKNSPASATNFQSLSDAVSRLSVCGVSAPVTITVAPNSGPYNEQVEILNIPNTSATNTVTFEGSGNTVSATPTSAKPGIMILNGAKYVKLNNFVITLPATATIGWGVQLINAADFNTISNNTINLPLTSTATSVNGIGAAAGVSTPGNNTNNTKIQNNIINGGYYGILINGNNPGANAVNNQITGNQVKDAYFYSIYLSNAVGTLVEGNDISRPARTVGANIYGVYVTANSVSTIISKNRIHNTHDMIPPTSAGTTYGIYVSVNAPVGSENIIKNNAIYNVKNNMGTFYGLSNSGNGAYYFHNTIVTDTTNTYQVIRGFHSGSPSTNLKVVNNIFSLAGGANTKHGIYLSGTAYTLQCDNNDIFLGKSGITGYYLADKVSLADWKTVNSNAYDQNSVAIDPLFTNVVTGNLKPIAPTLDNLGQPVPAVTEDILGALRNTTTPDMGAYEFGIPVNDVGIIAVSGPSTTGCGLSATETITVTIKNYGANTQTSVPVTYKVNGTGLVSETYTGSLAPNASATYTFTAKADLSVSGPYQIVAATALIGDLTTANDVETMNVVNTMILGIPQPFNFETAASGISRFQTITNLRSSVFEGTAASNGAGSTKGLIMDGVDHFSWTPAAGLTSPWSINPEHFAGAYFCFSPAGGNPTDPLWMSFDLKQLFKAANANTNFRVIVNGVQVGPTYRPPFTGTPIDWQKIYVDLAPYKNLQTIQIGLESSVKEAFANGTGTANLIDNVRIQRLDPTGVKEDKTLTTQLHVLPNPSTANFYVSLPAGKTFTLEVTDLTGKHIQSLQTKGEAQLNLEHAAKGVYLLKVSGENGTAVRKLILE